MLDLRMRLLKNQYFPRLQFAETNVDESEATTAMTLDLIERQPPRRFDDSVGKDLQSLTAYGEALAYPVVPDAAKQALYHLATKQAR